MAIERTLSIIKPDATRRNLTGKTLDQFNDPEKVAIIDPPAYKTGDLIYPYAKAAQ